MFARCARFLWSAGKGAWALQAFGLPLFFPAFWRIIFSITSFYGTTGTLLAFYYL